jgi:hypothetical protein
MLLECPSCPAEMPAPIRKRRIMCAFFKSELSACRQPEYTFQPPSRWSPYSACCVILVGGSDSYQIASGVGPRAQALCISYERGTTTVSVCSHPPRIHLPIGQKAIRSQTYVQHLSLPCQHVVATRPKPFNASGSQCTFRVK